ncbi:hypothetical protein C0J52_05120 [Blattella germanica]|nr:hypothetical protein C0J52_05120 [Blattella germanica]
MVRTYRPTQNTGRRSRKKIYKWKPICTRTAGRPKTRWLDDITEDIQEMKIRNWLVCIQNKSEWGEIVEKAKTSQKL